MSRKLKIAGPSRGTVKTLWGVFIGALVLLFFWHPFWRLVIDIATSADKLFPGGK